MFAMGFCVVQARAPLGPTQFHGDPTQNDSAPVPRWSKPSEWAEIRSELLENARDLRLNSTIQHDPKAEAYLETVLDSVLVGAPGWRPYLKMALGRAGFANAFSNATGQIWVEPGLLPRLENEAQLAAILAHEVGHVVANHSDAKIRLLWEEEGWKNVADPEWRSGFLAVSRRQEFEADSLGWLILAHTRYQLQAMDQALEILGHSFQPVGTRRWTRDALAGFPPLGIADSAWAPEASIPDTGVLPDSLLTHPGIQQRRKRLPQGTGSTGAAYLVSKPRFEALRQQTMASLPQSYLEQGYAQEALFESWSRLERSPKDTAMRHLFWKALVEVALQKCYHRQGFYQARRMIHAGSYGSLVHFLLRTDGLDLAAMALQERKRGAFRFTPDDSLHERILWSGLECAYPLQMDVFRHPRNGIPRSIRNQAKRLEALAKVLPIQREPFQDSHTVDEARRWNPKDVLLLPIAWSPHVESQPLGGRDAGRNQIASSLAGHIGNQYRGKIEPRDWSAESTETLEASRILMEYMERRIEAEGRDWARPLLPQARRAAARWRARQALWMQVISGVTQQGSRSLTGEMAGAPSLCVIAIDLETGNVVGRARERIGFYPSQSSLDEALSNLWNRLAPKHGLNASKDGRP